MPAKVSKEKGRTYYVDGKGEVCSMRPGGKDKRGEGVRVDREQGWLYFVDGSGEVKRTKRKGAK